MVSLGLSLSLGSLATSGRLGELLGGGGGGGGGFAGAERWRLVIDSVWASTGFDPRELYFMDDSNTRQLPGNGTTVSVSSQYPGDLIAYAFDNNINTRFGTDFSGTWPQWVEMDFGAVKKKITKVIIYLGESSSRNFSDGKIQYWNGTDWVTTDTYTDVHNYTFDVPLELTVTLPT